MIRCAHCLAVTHTTWDCPVLAESLARHPAGKGKASRLGLNERSK